MWGRKAPKWKLKKIRIPALRLRYRLLLYTAAVLASVISLVRDLRYGVREKVRPGGGCQSVLSRLTKDYHYRTLLFAGVGLLLNLVFAAFNVVVGIRSCSAWFGTLSVYYLLLGLLRFRAVRYDKNTKMQEG